MSKTKTSQNINQRKLEIRESRLKQTQQFILSNSISGLLNNHKWYNLFDWLNSNKKEFKIKMLLSGQDKKCDWIRELERTSILIDNSGDFIEFFEIKGILTKETAELLGFLDDSNFEYSIIKEDIEVYGYRR